MENPIVNKLSYDRLCAALELLKRKQKKSGYIAGDDVNEVLIVAGFEPIPNPRTSENEVQVMEVGNA